MLTPNVNWTKHFAKIDEHNSTAGLTPETVCLRYYQWLCAYEIAHLNETDTIEQVQPSAEHFASTFNISRLKIAAYGYETSCFSTHKTLDSELKQLAKTCQHSSVVITERAATVGMLYQSLLSANKRKRSGTHLTPTAIGTSLITALYKNRSDSAVCANKKAAPKKILDPAVGGAALLLAAAQHSVENGCSATETAQGLVGFDIDSVSVAISQAAISLWVLHHQNNQTRKPSELTELKAYGRFEQGDSLTIDLPEVDLVIANPPFLSRLRSATALDKSRQEKIDERWGQYRATYTDEAALFLVAAAHTLSRGGALCMILPISVLASKHCQKIRAAIDEIMSIVGIWVAPRNVFSDAQVQVCAVVATKTDYTNTTKCWVGADFQESEPGRNRSERVAACLEGKHGLGSPARQPEPWSHIAARSKSIPTLTIARNGKTIGDIARVTAGFRDQFYGLIPFTREATKQELAQLEKAKKDGGGSIELETVCLTTTGMLDPLANKWGTRPFRFASKDWNYPVIDITRLKNEDHKLYQWVKERLRPKLLVATQTKIVETYLDTIGYTLPVTPTITVETDDVSDLIKALAVLHHPYISVWLHLETFGTALSLDAIKVSAKQLAQLPLPQLSETTCRDISRLANKPIELARYLIENVELADGPAGEEIFRWWQERT